MSVSLAVLRQLSRPGGVRRSLEGLEGTAPAILGNAASLWMSVGFNSALGFVFWWVAARQFPVEAVGLAAAAISAMSLLGTAAMLGQGTALVGELHRRSATPERLLSTSLVAPLVAGAAMGLAFALLGRWLSSDFDALGRGVLPSTLFTMGVVLTATTMVLDQALVGFLLGSLQLRRNAVFAVAKLLLLPVAWRVNGSDGLAIYAVWAAGNVISLGLLLGVAARKGKLRRSSLPHADLLRRLSVSGLQHHALNLSLRAPGLALTLIVTAALSTTAAAYFYASWMIAGLGFSAASALAVTLYAVGADSPAALVRRVRFTLGLGLVFGVCATAGLMIIGSPVLALFGPAYAQEAAGSLRLLSLAIFALVLKEHYVAIKRIHSELPVTAVLVTLGGLAEVVGALLGGRLGGLEGIATGWLIAVCLEALCMAPTVLRTVLPRRTAAAAAGLRPPELDCPPAEAR